MEKPYEISGVLSKFPGSHDGRPPDPMLAPSESVVSSEEVQVLERHGSPIPYESMPLTKRGRTGAGSEGSRMEDGSVPIDSDTHMGEVDAAINPVVSIDLPSLPKGPELFPTRHIGGPPKPSFRDSLLGRDGTRTTDQLISELDVEVTDDDVLIGGDSVIPEIRFSDKVHEAIDRKLSKSIIIRLLGKSIGYRALLNRIQSLWNPLGEIQLIDLDNEYFLVRFAKEEDYVRVLTGGPWVIYGSYLTVQPWSRNFSTNSEYPKRIMVWTMLLDRLAVTIDLNKPLVSDIVIDGTRQDIEYEGLPDICFSCGKYGHSKDLCGKEAVGSTNNVVETGRDPKELFGPWMQVQNRRRRAPNNHKSDVVTDPVMPIPTSRGSRFAILQTSLGCEDVECQVSNGAVTQLQVQPRNPTNAALHKGKETITSSSHELGHSGPCSSSGGVGSGHTSKEMVIDLGVNPSEMSEKDVGGVLIETGKDVASSEKIVYSEVTLNKKNHTAVRIGEPSEANSIKERRGRVLPASFRSGNSRNKSKIASALKSNLKQGPKPKKRDDRGSVNPNLAGRISALVSELDKAKSDAAVHVDSRDGNVQWHANGALDPVSRRYFRLLVRKHKPEIFCIMEPRISGVQVDNFIRTSGFEFSYRIEASGFSGGIYTKRSRLWCQLQALDPAGDRPWILEGISMLLLLQKNEREVPNNISEFQDKSQKWSLDLFGHIDKRKNQILARLKGIEKALERRANPFLIELEISLKRELDKILEQEESLWFQRARTKWIQWGDRNTAYFHATTLSRCRRNHINMLHLPDGSWSNDHTILKEHAIDFFRTLLTSEARNSGPTSQPGNFFQFDNSSMQQANTSSAPVAAMVDDNEGWDWIRLKQWLSQDAVAKIAAIKPPRSDAGADTPGWRWGKSRTFTVRSAYQAIHTPSTATNESHWSKIWRLPVPQRIRVFMWLVFRQRLLTNAERFRRHLTLSDSCPLCHSAPETIDHMLRTCPRALLENQPMEVLDLLHQDIHGASS
ncbi:hypothetical protein GQ457_09G026140 [Hibiscus cannabinus]